MTERRLKAGVYDTGSTVSAGSTKELRDDGRRAKENVQVVSFASRRDSFWTLMKPRANWSLTWCWTRRLDWRGDLAQDDWILLLSIAGFPESRDERLSQPAPTRMSRLRTGRKHIRQFFQHMTSCRHQSAYANPIRPELPQSPEFDDQCS